MPSATGLPSSWQGDLADDVQGNVVALFYDAALRPECWPDALEELRLHMQATVVILNLISPRRNEIKLINRGMEAAVAAFDKAGADPEGRRTARLAANHSGFLRDSDYMDARQLEEDPSRRYLAQDHGLGPTVSGLLHFDSGAIAVLGVERAAGMPDFSDAEIAWLDRLRPHLLRACIVSEAARQIAAEDRVRTLELLGYAAATLDAEGLVIAVNSRLSRLLPGAARAGTRLRLSDPAADAALAAALERGVGRSVVQPSGADAPGVVVHMLPVSGAGAGMLGSAAWLLVALEPGLRAGAETLAGTDLLEALYGLTPAEARVAVRIARGERVNDVAAANGVMRETVRSQVRSILAKTGLSRQTDLAALLATIQLRR